MRVRRMERREREEEESHSRNMTDCLHLHLSGKSVANIMAARLTISQFVAGFKRGGKSRSIHHTFNHKASFYSLKVDQRHLLYPLRTPYTLRHPKYRSPSRVQLPNMPPKAVKEDKASYLPSFSFRTANLNPDLRYEKQKQVCKSTEIRSDCRTTGSSSWEE
jgi:hypothetical protein